MTITELLQAYEKSLTTSLEDQVFTVAGTLDVGRAPQYGDHLYVDLIEGTSKIRIYIRAEDRALNGRRVEAIGRLKRNVRLLSGTISLTLYATRLTNRVTTLWVIVIFGDTGRCRVWFPGTRRLIRRHPEPPLSTSPAYS